MSSYFVESRTSEWPPFCTCCGAGAEVTSAKNLAIPLCKVCHDHLRMPPGRLLASVLVAAVWILVVCVATGGNGVAAAVLGIGGLYAVMWWAIFRRRTTGTCATKIQAPVVASMAHGGRRIFMFKSEGYARKFAEVNVPSVIWRQGEKKPASV